MADGADATASLEGATRSDAARRWRRLAVWWPALLPPLVIPASYLIDASGWRGIIGKGPQETLAIVLMGVAVTTTGIGWLIRRDRIGLVLTALAVAFLCREIHFRGTHKGVYVALGLIAVWCVVWRRSLLAELRSRPRTRRWLILMVWAYAIAVLVQRRVLRGMAGEDQLHVPMEEVGENVAHLFLIILSLV